MGHYNRGITGSNYADNNSANSTIEAKGLGSVKANKKGMNTKT